MHAVERRRRRSTETLEALALQLAACCDDGAVAMVIADGEGVPLAQAGDEALCEQVAGRLRKVGSRIQDFHGTLLGEGQDWACQMTRIEVEDRELLVCAVGGTAESRQRQVRRSTEAARRILASSEESGVDGVEMTPAV